jgi:hypothetical protein
LTEGYSGSDLKVTIFFGNVGTIYSAVTLWMTKTVIFFCRISVWRLLTALSESYFRKKNKRRR